MVQIVNILEFSMEITLTTCTMVTCIMSVLMERSKSILSKVSDINPSGCTPEHRCKGHDSDHVHGPGCGHEPVPHGDHVDYLVDGHLHHPHGDHCDDHGPVEVINKTT